MPESARDGKSCRLSRARRLVDDLLWFSQTVPSVPHLRRSRIPRLAAARKNAELRVSWPVLFMKAYANVCVRRPALRRLYMKWPWGRLYQHPETVARVTVSRELYGNTGVMLGRFYGPERTSLAEMHEQISRMATAPLSDFPDLVRLGHLAAAPRFLRRFCWWLVGCWLPRFRADRMGTFMVSTVSKFGAVSLHVPVISGSTLSFGPVDDDGNVDVVLIYDHRVFDGAENAQALAELEAELEGPVCDELIAMQPGKEVKVRPQAVTV